MEKSDFLLLKRHDGESYLNTIISEVNDHIVRLSIMTARYPWHYHPNSDETFIGIEGTVIIETANELFELMPGNVITIPKGVRHCTRPKGEQSKNLTVERADIETVTDSGEIL